MRVGLSDVHRFSFSSDHSWSSEALAAGTDALSDDLHLWGYMTVKHRGGWSSTCNCLMSCVYIFTSVVTACCFVFSSFLSSDLLCCMWIATSAWTCPLRTTRWSPHWETAMAAVPSSGCSVTWPLASDSSPQSSVVLHPTSPGFPYPHQMALTTHHAPLAFTSWPRNAENWAAAAFLPFDRITVQHRFEDKLHWHLHF